MLHTSSKMSRCPGLSFEMSMTEITTRSLFFCRNVCRSQKLAVRWLVIKCEAIFVITSVVLARVNMTCVVTWRRVIMHDLIVGKLTRTFTSPTRYTNSVEYD